jgi:hypothetical protein
MRLTSHSEGSISMSSFKSEKNVVVVFESMLTKLG